jgi:hypothetical protein
MAKFFTQAVGKIEQRLALAADNLAGEAKLLKRAEGIGHMPRSGCHDRHP